MIKLTTKELLKMSPQEFSGKLIAFATDTVFGVGAMYDDHFLTAQTKIFQMKQRDASKPLAVLVSSFEQISPHVVLNEKINDLTKYWPGALTIIFKTNDDYFDKIAHNGSIGIRIPNCASAQAILNHLGVMATTSINKSGEAPLNDISLIEEHFASFIDYLVIDEYASSGKSSTVVDARTLPYQIIRLGEIKIN